jgi:FixJ family two-component response regulator
LIISIVDDDESVRIAIDSLVRAMGYGSACFDSAQAFLASTAASHTACLITDVQMPGISGLELQALLLEQGCRIPVIVMTAFPEKLIEKRALEAGARAFLTKPFSGQCMLEQIESALAL